MYAEVYAGELPTAERQPRPDHEVLFFGCVAVTIAEVWVRGLTLQQQLQSCSDAQFRVRATVAPVGTEAVERMGESVKSNMYSLHNAEIADELLIPVMLERASHATTNTNSTTGISAASSSPVLNNNKNVEKRDTGDELHESDAGKSSLELVLDIIFFRGDTSTVVIQRIVAIDSLHDVGKQNCGVATARVSAAVLRESCLFGPFASFQAHTSTPSSMEGGEDGDWSGVEVQLIVRAIDASAPLRLMLDAEDKARSLLRLPKPHPRTMFVFPQLTTLPYGAVPLVALYHFYCGFFEQFFNKTLKTAAHVLQLLRDGEGSSEGNNMGSWCALHTVDLRPVLLGDDALAPLLATLSHCSSLTTLLLNENNVGDITCYRLAALFHKHRCLQSILIGGNSIHESGAEQLLRLVRCNKRITKLCANGNPCTPRVLERIQRVLKMNTETYENDPFNVLSDSYMYALSPVSFPSTIVKKALAVWVMLTAAPVSVDPASSAVVVATTDAGAEGTPSTIPQCALAPLLNEVMRTVAFRMSSIIQDPWVRMVFADIESYRGAYIPLRKNSKDIESSNSNNNNNNNNNNSNNLANNMVSNCSTEATSTETEHISLVDVEELYNSSFLHIVVVTMRGMAAGGEWGESTAVLRGIGKRQKKIGVMPEYYRDALQAFTQSITGVCGKDHADVEHSVAFLQCLALGVRTAVST